MKNWIITQWKTFVNYFNNNKKTIYRNFIIVFVASTIFLLIDLLTKHFLFQDPGEGPGQKVDSYSNWLFGIRSVRNPGLTFFGPEAVNVALITFFNVIIWISCLVSLIVLKNALLIVCISLIFSGSMGNTIDRLHFGYVRDIIYLPWFDRGTFNFADVDVILGSFMFVGTMIVITIKK